MSGTPKPTEFADGRTTCSGGNAPNSSARKAPRPQSTQTPGKSSEGSTCSKSTYEQIGENVKSVALYEAYQEFAGDLNFGRSPIPGTEQNGDTRSQSAAPQPTRDMSQASMLQFFEHQLKQGSSSYKQTGNNYLSVVSHRSYQSFGGSLNFSE